MMHHLTKTGRHAVSRISTVHAKNHNFAQLCNRCRDPERSCGCGMHGAAFQGTNNEWMNEWIWTRMRIYQRVVKESNMYVCSHLYLFMVSTIRETVVNKNSYVIWGSNSSRRGQNVSCERSTLLENVMWRCHIIGVFEINLFVTFWQKAWPVTIFVARDLSSALRSCIPTCAGSGDKLGRHMAI